MEEEKVPRFHILVLPLCSAACYSLISVFAHVHSHTHTHTGLANVLLCMLDLLWLFFFLSVIFPICPLLFPPASHFSSGAMNISGIT